MKSKKGRFGPLNDIFVYITFVVVFLIFLMVVSAASTDISFDNTLLGSTSNQFEEHQANNKLLTFLKTSVPVFRDFQCNLVKGDKYTIADLLAVTKDRALLKNKIKEALNGVCQVNGKPKCDWKVEIEYPSQTTSSLTINSDISKSFDNTVEVKTRVPTCEMNEVIVNYHHSY